MRHLRAAAAAIVAVAIVFGTAAGAGAARARVVPVAALDNPVGFTFTPNGRVVYLERATGEVRFLDPRTGADRLFLPDPNGLRRARLLDRGRAQRAGLVQRLPWHLPTGAEASGRRRRSFSGNDAHVRGRDEGSMQRCEG